MKTTIVDIKRFAVHDGDGIRTTVFLKGCPLKCVWCHNPESISFEPELAYYENKCVHCGRCVSVCPTGSHKINEKGHIFDRSKCISCGECAKVCPKNALVFYGKEMTVDEIMAIVLEDKDFYDNSGGGLTISGGECLMHYEFCAKLLKSAKQHSIHTAVDTCGFVSKAAIDKVAPYTDIFLYDFKAFNEDVHIKCTGHSNKTILENLKYIDSLGKKIEIRIPFVPGYNDNEMEAIANFLKPLKNITKVRVLPYHNFAGSKYEALGIENTLPPVLPTNEEVEGAEQIFERG